MTVDDNPWVTMLYPNTSVNSLIPVGSEVFSKLVHAQTHTRENSTVVPAKNHCFMRTVYKLNVASEKLKCVLWASSTSLLPRKEWLISWPYSDHIP